MTSFCASCGQPRDEAARFCGACGAQFSDPADATRLDLAADATRIDPLADSADPFASWYQPERRDTALGFGPGARAGAGAGEPGAGEQGTTEQGTAAQGTGEQWQPTQTVRAAPGSSPAVATPPYLPFAPIPPGPPGPATGARRRGGRRGGLLVAAVVVVLAAAGGAAYAVAGGTARQHPAAAPATTPSVTAPASSAPASSAPASSAPASQSASTPSASPTATASPTLSLVAVAPGVASSAVQPAVETLLSHYFRGINRHDYPEYADTLDPAVRAEQSPSSFTSGYGSTTDSGMTLTALADNGAGDLTATVTFTSHQLATQSVDKSTCNYWTLDLSLVPQGSGYLIGAAPAGYQPKYTDC